MMIGGSRMIRIVFGQKITNEGRGRGVRRNLSIPTFFHFLQSLAINLMNHYVSGAHLSNSNNATGRGGDGTSLPNTNAMVALTRGRHKFYRHSLLIRIHA